MNLAWVVSRCASTLPPVHSCRPRLTSPAGLYLFTDVAPGSYYIVFINTQADTAFTIREPGRDDAHDSDVDLTLRCRPPRRQRRTHGHLHAGAWRG